jgi:hypothetical protein
MNHPLGYDDRPNGVRTDNASTTKGTMALTWIEVADTAIKIGLGAVVSGVGAYVLAQLSHKNSISKEVVSRKIAILEEVNELASVYFYYVTRLTNSVDGMLTANPEREGADFNDDEYEFLHRNEDNLTEILEKRNRAIAKARLLKLSSAADEILKFNEILSDYRKAVIFGRRFPTAKDMANWQSKFNERRLEFYRLTSDYLASLS